MPTILRNVKRDPEGLWPEGLWIEPFLGSGVIALNAPHKRAVLTDSNLHIIRFYQAVKNGAIDGATIREFLEQRVP